MKIKFGFGTIAAILIAVLLVAMAVVILEPGHERDSAPGNVVIPGYNPDDSPDYIAELFVDPGEDNYYLGVPDIEVSVLFEGVEYSVTDYSVLPERFLGIGDQTFTVLYDGCRPVSVTVDVELPENYSLFEIRTADELKSFSELVNSGNIDTDGLTVSLNSDIDFDDSYWNPIGNEDYPFLGIFNGNGHTVSNFNVENDKFAGLFGIAGTKETPATIQNVKVEDINISTSHYAGGIVGYIIGNVTGCNVSEAVLISTPDLNGSVYDNGDKVGGIAGIQSYGSITGCSVENVSLIAYRDVGGIVGCITNMLWGDAYKPTVSGNTISGTNYVTADQTVGFYGYEDANAGEFVGRTINGTVDDNTKANGAEVFISVKMPASTAEGLATAFSKGGEVILVNDITPTSTITVPAGKTVTLDLNGYTISDSCESSEAHIFMISNKGTVIVKDSSSEQDGKITYSGNSSTGWIFDIEGKLILESGTLELTGTWSIGYAADVRPNAWGTDYTEPTEFIMNGGHIISSDGAVRVASSSFDGSNATATFIMNGGSIESAYDGVFIQQSNGSYDRLTFIMNGGFIKSDKYTVREYLANPNANIDDVKYMTVVLNPSLIEYTGSDSAMPQMIFGDDFYIGQTVLDYGVQYSDIYVSEPCEFNVDGFVWTQITDDNSEYCGYYLMTSE